MIDKATSVKHKEKFEDTKGLSDAIYWRRTANTMTKRERQRQHKSHLQNTENPNQTNNQERSAMISSSSSTSGKYQLEGTYWKSESEWTPTVIIKQNQITV
jgi:hypothetical protein